MSAISSIAVTISLFLRVSSAPLCYLFFFLLSSLPSSPFLPPEGSNRGRYRNPKVDELTDAIRVEMNQQKRKELTSEVQKILAEDLPYIPLWYADVVSVHRSTLGELFLSPTGDYEFLAAH